MTRLVRGADGRMWTVRGRMSWANMDGADDFEHDVAGGHGPGIGMIAILVILTVVLLVWRPTGVVVPGWLILALVLLFLFFPARWALRRPWTIVAETPGDLDEHPPERWVGTVRGVFNVRQETSKVARNIEVYSLPNVDGPLQPVD
jgi:hypothetical protein